MSRRRQWRWLQARQRHSEQMVDRTGCGRCGKKAAEVSTHEAGKGEQCGREHTRVGPLLKEST
jgi:tRNA G26 N,N-dimethylase Trm1